MWLPKRTAPLAALLALTVAAPTLAGPPAVALADDEDPDVAITYAGAGATPEVLRFTVKNVGKEKVPATTVKVETLSPAPKNEQTIKVPALDKGGTSFDFTYTLAGPCNGHEVKAVVELKKDEDPKNNAVQLTACEAKPAPQPKPEGKPQGQPKPDGNPQGSSGSGPGGGLAEARTSGGLTSSLAGLDSGPAGSLADARERGDLERPISDQTPAHMRPGQHTIELRPSAWRTIVQKKSGPLPPFTGPMDNTVGWYQDEGAGGSVVVVSQQAVNFDLGDFDKIPRKFISKAVLAFDESPDTWRDTDGNDRFVDGCVAQLGIASVEWASRNLNARVPSTLYEDVTPGARREWEVTHHVRDQLREPIDAALRHGYTLDGSLMIDQLEGDGMSSCLSNVGNVRLVVSYTVLQP